MEKVRFLVIRFSSIGDIVLTTPLVRNLKEQIKKSEVHFLTKKKFANLVVNNPYIDKVHVLDDHFSKLINSLKKEEFDYVIDLHKNLRSMRVKKALHRVSFSFNKLNLKKWMYVQFKKNKMPDIHIVDRYFETLSLFDVKNDNKGLDYFFSENYSYSGLWGNNYFNGYITVVLGANHATKQIPVEILSTILNKTDKPIVLIGGEKEKKTSENLLKRISIPVLNLCGQITIDDSAHIMKNSKVVLTPDTGMMHIASALQKPIVSVWGNTTPELGMYPYMPQNKGRYFIAEVKNLKCRPCSKIGYEKCPKNHFNCMMQQDISQIVSQLNLYWNQNE